MIFVVVVMLCDTLTASASSSMEGPVLPLLNLEASFGKELPTSRQDGWRPCKLRLAREPSSPTNFKWPMQATSIDCEVKVRGATSAAFPKHQYSLKTYKSYNKLQKLNVAFGDLWRKDHVFVLNGQYGDATLIRNSLAYDLSNAIGRWAVQQTFVEVNLTWLNGNTSYGGVYTFGEAITSKRLNLRTKEGGMLITSDFTSYHAKGRCTACEGYEDLSFWLKDTKELPGNCGKTEDMSVFLSRAMGCNGSRDCNDMDIGSFIDYFIIQELSDNVDAYTKSVFMYRQRGGGQLVAGPLWDFDMAFTGWGWPDTWAHTWRWGTEKKSYMKMFYRHLIRAGNVSAFVPIRHRMKRRWEELRRTELSDAGLDSRIDNLIEPLNASNALWRNSAVWPVYRTTPLWPGENLMRFHSYGDAYYDLKAGLRRRAHWLDVAFAQSWPDHWDEGFQYMCEPSPTWPLWTITDVDGILAMSAVLLVSSCFLTWRFIRKCKASHERWDVEHISKTDAAYIQIVDHVGGAEGKAKSVESKRIRGG